MRWLVDEWQWPYAGALVAIFLLAVLPLWWDATDTALALVYGLFVARLEPIGRVLPDRLEHPIPLLGESDKALLDERLQGVDVRIGDFLSSSERAAACEDGKAREELLLFWCEKLVAPLDGRPQRLLARIGVATALQKVEP